MTADAADKATADEERAMALFDEEQLRARIAASFKLHDPTVPINCVDCGEIVSTDRIKAYPRTRRCQPCASEVELDYARRHA